MADPASALGTCIDLVEKLNAEIARGIKLSEERGKAARAAAADMEKARRDMYGPDWRAAQDAFPDQTHVGGGGGPSGLQGYLGTEGLNPFSTDVLDAEGFKAGSYKAANSAAAQYDLQIAAQMEDFARRADAAFGKQTFIGQGFRQLAQFVREGRFSGADASRYAQAIFQNFAAGAMQEMSDPDTSPLAKAIDAEFLSFLASGRI